MVMIVYGGMDLLLWVVKGARTQGLRLRVLDNANLDNWDSAALLIFCDFCIHDFLQALLKRKLKLLYIHWSPSYWIRLMVSSEKHFFKLDTLKRMVDPASALEVKAISLYATAPTFFQPP
ncbi:hypothetical protein Tco_0889752 [Tanacetum coccineum]